MASSPSTNEQRARIHSSPRPRGKADGQGAGQQKDHTEDQVEHGVRTGGDGGSEVFDLRIRHCHVSRILCLGKNVKGKNV